MSDYNTLLAAIHALDPFSVHFNLRSVENRKSDPTVWCASCKSLAYGHTPKCPVTHLRNILNDSKPKEFIPEVGYQRPEAEVSICGDILTIKNVSDKDMVIPLSSEGKPFIKSPTDNGV